MSSNLPTEAYCKEIQEQLRVAVNNVDIDNKTEEYARIVAEFFQSIPGIETTQGKGLKATSAVNGAEIHTLRETTSEEWDTVLDKTHSASEIWRKVPLEERGRFFEILGQKMNQHTQLFSTILAIDVAKSLSDGAKEAAKANAWFDWAREETQLAHIRPDVTYSLNDQILHTDLNVNTSDYAVSNLVFDQADITRHEPDGTVMVMTSYNYPIALSMAGIVPALMAGNSVAFKPSSSAPHWAFAFKSIFDEALNEWAGVGSHTAALTSTAPINKADLPALRDNLFKIVVGRNDEFLKNVDHAFLVGSRDAYHKMKELRGDKKTTGELGGNSLVAVMESAIETEVDLNKVAMEVYTANSSMAGQRCTAARLVAVQNCQATQGFVDALTDMYRLSETNVIGNPFDPATTTGAMVKVGDYNKMQEALKKIRELQIRVEGQDKTYLVPITGGTLISDNQVPRGEGIYVKPALVDWSGIDFNLNPEAFDVLNSIAKKELFAPVLHILRKVNNVHEAIELQNDFDNEQLAASIYSQDPEERQAFRAGVKAGTIIENGPPKDNSPVKPHGNFDVQSFSGGEDGLVKYTRQHNVFVENSANIKAEVANAIGLPQAARSRAA